MSDVRFLASLGSRGTGIPRTSTQVPQRNPNGTTSSHVSASPGAGARAHAQVNAARRPPGQQQRQEAPTVTIVDRRATSAPGEADASAARTSAGDSASQFPTVQIVERTRSGAIASPFSVEQMMLLGHLLDRYRENTIAIDDAANAALAEGALSVLAGLLQAAGAPSSSVSPPSAVAGRGRSGRRRVVDVRTAAAVGGVAGPSAGDSSRPISTTEDYASTTGSTDGDPASAPTSSSAGA